MSREQAAAAVLRLAAEHMVAAIEDITVNQGVNPQEAVIVGGGGSFGLTAVPIARRLGCREVLLPPVAAALSAAGALMSDLTRSELMTFPTSTRDFDAAGANWVIAALEERCADFIADAGRDAIESGIELSAEARYPSQIWEIDVPLPVRRFNSEADLENFKAAFHAAHERLFAIRDAGSEVEIVTWKATARCRLHDPEVERASGAPQADVGPSRSVYFASTGRIEVPVTSVSDVPLDGIVEGPAIIELPSTTVVLDPEASARRTADGSVVLSPTDQAVATLDAMTEVQHAD
jgi:N-methylhydantoinase A